MHCLLIELNHGRVFANLSELLRAVLSGRCKYCLHSRNLVFVIIADTTRLWQSSRLSQYISCLDSAAYRLTKRMWEGFEFLIVMVNLWLLFKRVHLAESTHIPSISVFIKKSSNNSCDNRLFSKTGTGLFHAFNCYHRTINVFPVGCFALFRYLKTKW